MLAIVLRAPGGPEQLALESVPDPTPNAHQVLIDVHAAAVNRPDLLQRRGLYPPPPGESDILGLECAGVVAAVGAEVQDFAPGDRVMALLPGGGYAERVAVHERLVVAMPANLSFEEAAAIPESFLTAHQALFDAGALNPGERVLVHAAASSIGCAVVQVARELGAFVFATTRSQTKRALLDELGVHRAIDTTLEDFAEVVQRETAGRGVDVIVDIVGAKYAAQNHAALAVGGRWVVVGLVSGGRAELDLTRLVMRRQTIAGIILRTRSLPEKSALMRAFRRELLPWIAEGRLRPVIDSVFPLAEAGKAHARMEANLNAGKIVLRVR